MALKKNSFRSFALFVFLACLTMSSAGKTVHLKYRVDPNEIKLIPTEAAQSYLAPFLASAVNDRTHKPANLILDESGMSCEGISYPLAEWRLLENAYVFAKDSGEIRILIATRDSHWLVGKVFGPTGKGLVMYLKASSNNEAAKIVSALKSLGIQSFPGADIKKKK